MNGTNVSSQQGSAESLIALSSVAGDISSPHASSMRNGLIIPVLQSLQHARNVFRGPCGDSTS